MFFRAETRHMRLIAQKNQGSNESFLRTLRASKNPVRVGMGLQKFKKSPKILTERSVGRYVVPNKMKSEDHMS